MHEMKCNSFFPFMNIRGSQFLDQTFLRFYSKLGKRDPYDVLGLKKTSSKKDVKKAYIKLCKELHPDMKPGDVSQHKKFIELNDAYESLQKSENTNKINSGFYENPDVFWHSTKSKKEEVDSETIWPSKKAWYERPEYPGFSYNPHSGNFYYYRGHNKMNKLKAVAGCLVLMILGSILYLSAYRYAHYYTLEKVDEKSRQLSKSYSDVRKNALSEEKESLNVLKRKLSE